MISLQQHGNITILRDDRLEGGTKSVALRSMMDEEETEEFVYASPCEGGFQIALAHGARKYNRRATIVCAQRKQRHPNTKEAAALGANIVEIFPGYLSTVQARAREYVDAHPGSRLISFGANDDGAVEAIAARTRQVLAEMDRLPTVIWCPVGSGTLLEGIVQGTEDEDIRIVGVQVGKKYEKPLPPRVTLHAYPAEFKTNSKYKHAPFPSMPHYDLKAYETMVNHPTTASEPCVLFWNVMGPSPTESESNGKRKKRKGEE